MRYHALINEYTTTSTDIDIREVTAVHIETSYYSSHPTLAVFDGDIFLGVAQLDHAPNQIIEDFARAYLEHTRLRSVI